METATAITWTLGDRLAKARRIAEVSTADMALFLGLDRKTINNYEADRIRPKAAIVRAWASRCDMPFQWLAGDDFEQDFVPDLHDRNFRCSPEMAGAA